METKNDRACDGDGDGLIYTLAAELQELREAQAAAAEEIKTAWRAARNAPGQTEAFRILERMVDRLGYGRTENNPPLVSPNRTPPRHDKLSALWHPRPTRNA